MPVDWKPLLVVEHLGWGYTAACQPHKPSFGQDSMYAVWAAGSLTYPGWRATSLAQTEPDWRSASMKFNETEATPKAGISVLTSEHLCHDVSVMRAKSCPKTAPLPVITLTVGLLSHHNLTSWNNLDICFCLNWNALNADSDVLCVCFFLLTNTKMFLNWQ